MSICIGNESKFARERNRIENIIWKDILFIRKHTVFYVWNVYVKN